MALLYHKRCSLIWKISGGAEKYQNNQEEEDDGECDDGVEVDEEEQVDVLEPGTANVVSDWLSDVEGSRAAVESDAVKDPMERTESDKTLDTPMA
ncbi:hypothetical protein HDU96_010990 [Phlyctochytrium bullatum]|nr:hypothetical protein HDU96_010990 [Phlyctochytrium bullatum]